MKILSPLPHRRGRIEIIPLIDIMFFLLAAFMVVSISKIRINSLKVSLPTDVPAAVRETKEDFVSVSIDVDGQVQMDKTKMANKEMFSAALKDLFVKNQEQKILISADQEAHHGDVMKILGIIRQAGFQKVAFALKNEPHAGGGGNSTSTPSMPTSAMAPSSSPSVPLPTPAPTVPLSAPSSAPSQTPATTPAPTHP